MICRSSAYFFICGWISIATTISNFCIYNTLNFRKFFLLVPKSILKLILLFPLIIIHNYLKVILMLSKNQLGFLYMFLSVCAFSIMDLIVKWSEHYPLGQVLFFRGFFGLLFYFLIIPKDRLRNFYYTKRPGLHF